jgi:uncharacterized protein (TIGR03083 family)
MDVMALARQERLDLADFLASLRPEQWDHPSRCAGWSIRDVAAHVVSYEEHGGADLIKRVTKARFRPGRFNEVALAEYTALDPQDLVSFLRDHLTPRGATARFGGRVGLVDAMVHHQDMRRPLGMPRQIPAERLLCALPFAVTAPPLRGFWHARGVRLTATDVDWSRGKGLDAHGPGEAVLMVLAGRSGVAQDLIGPGATVLQHRLGRTTRAVSRARSRTTGRH